MLKRYPSGATMNFATSIASTADGCYALASIYDEPGPSYAMGLTRLDALGQPQWSRTYGSVHPWPEVIGLGSNDVLVLGSSYQGRDLVVVRADANGDTLWTLKLDVPFPLQCQAQSAVELANGDLIIGAYTHKAFYLTRLDAQGGFIWSHGYQGGPITSSTLSGQRLGMLLTSDSSIVMAGQLATANVTESDLFLLKTDLNGNVIWGNFIQGPDEDGLRAVVETDDGGFLAVGYHWTSNRIMVAVRVDAAGQLLWSRIYTSIGNSSCRALMRTDDGHYIVCGSGEDTNGSHPLLFKLDDSGNVVWSFMHGQGAGFTDAKRVGAGAAYSLGWDLTVQPDLGWALSDTLGASYCGLIPYALTAVDVTLGESTTVNTIAGLSPLAFAPVVTTIAQTEILECASTAVPPAAAHAGLSIHPNPATDRLTLELPEGHRASNVRIIDQGGRVILALNAPRGMIEVAQLQAGLYVVEVEGDDGGRLRERLIVQ